MREVRVESSLGSARQISTISLRRSDAGCVGGFVGEVSTSRYFPSSEAPADRSEQRFHASTPKEAELFLEQYVSLFSNNSSSDSTITVLRNGRPERSSSSDGSFSLRRNPFFPELAQNAVDPPLATDRTRLRSHPPEPLSSDPNEFFQVT